MIPSRGDWIRRENELAHTSFLGGIALFISLQCESYHYVRVLDATIKHIVTLLIGADDAYAALENETKFSRLL